MDFKEIDSRACEISKNFRKYEAELLEIIIQVFKKKVYRKFGYSSLFQYVVNRLQLSESQAYLFINVAKKSVEVPELQKSIQSGRLSLSKAKRITSVVTKDNSEQWISMAEKVTQKKLEREVALSKPALLVPEKFTYMPLGEPTLERVQMKKDSLQVKLELGVSERIMIQLRRAQDLVSQKQRKSVTLEMTLQEVVHEYIKRHDPVEKAKRQKVRGKLDSKSSAEIESSADVESGSKSKIQRDLRKVGSRRVPLPAVLKHQVYFKSGGRCTSIGSDGRRCPSTRFLEIHHIQPLSQGGEDKLENLTLLCSGHHKAVHVV